VPSACGAFKIPLTEGRPGSPAEDIIFEATISFPVGNWASESNNNLRSRIHRGRARSCERLLPYARKGTPRAEVQQRLVLRTGGQTMRSRER